MLTALPLYRRMMVRVILALSLLKGEEDDDGEVKGQL